MTTNFERPGVYSSWRQRSKKVPRDMVGAAEDLLAARTREFETYLELGTLPDRGGQVPNARYPELRTWYWLGISFHGAALAYHTEVERRALLGEAVGPVLPARAFVCAYTAEMIHNWCGVNGERGPGVGGLRIPSIALGVVHGCQPQAFQLAKIRVARHRRSGGTGKFPIFDFIVRIFADYLDERELDARGLAKDEPIHNALLETWRVEDPDALIEVCLAACDYHTQRCRVVSQKRADQDYEFSNDDFARTPLAVLLVFKLRVLLGLENPEIDHPLMNTPLGVLPEETSMDAYAEGPDDLVCRVRQRMMEDGYNEEEIFSLWGV